MAATAAGSLVLPSGDTMPPVLITNSVTGNSISDTPSSGGDDASTSALDANNNTSVASSSSKVGNHTSGSSHTNVTGASSSSAGTGSSSSSSSSGGRRKISLPSWFRQTSSTGNKSKLTRQHTIDSPGNFQARFLRKQVSTAQQRVQVRPLPMLILLN
uniref:Uncharacterized protein n=1 Tax=Cacopsylla melanoneura TaxID=428564 RepID=A0A8D8MEF0_9HEMI